MGMPVTILGGIIGGVMTPPFVGTIMYVVCALSKISIGELSREVWPFAVALIIALFLVTCLPWLWLWLPDLAIPIKWQAPPGRS